MQKAKTQSTNTKARPQNARELVEAITNNKLDARTSHAKAILSAREVIAISPNDASKALLTDSLAVWGVCQSVILAEISRSGALLEDSKLIPIFTELQKVQTYILKTASALTALDEKEKKENSNPSNKRLDISTLFEG